MPLLKTQRCYHLRTESRSDLRPKQSARRTDLRSRRTPKQLL